MRQAAFAAYRRGGGGGETGPRAAKLALRIFFMFSSLLKMRTIRKTRIRRSTLKPLPKRTVI